MSFMQKQVEKFEAWQVETTCGTECVPADLCHSDQLADYLEGKQTEDEPTLVNGWFCRLSAPGYMDRTEWSGPYETEKEAMEALEEMYPDGNERA